MEQLLAVEEIKLSWVLNDPMNSSAAADEH